jgi:hypothetical protein
MCVVSRRDMATQTSPGSALQQDRSTDNRRGLPSGEHREPIPDHNPSGRRPLSALTYRDNESNSRVSERMALLRGEAAFRQQLPFTDELLNTSHLLPSEIYSQEPGAEDFYASLGTGNHPSRGDVPLGYSNGPHFNPQLGSDTREAAELAQLIGILEGRPENNQEVWHTPLRGLTSADDYAGGLDQVEREDSCQAVCRTPFLQHGGGPARQYPVHPSLHVVDQTERPSSRRGPDHEPATGLSTFWRPNKLY